MKDLKFESTVDGCQGEGSKKGPDTIWLSESQAEMNQTSSVNSDRADVTEKTFRLIFVAIF